MAKAMPIKPFGRLTDTDLNNLATKIKKINVDKATVPSVVKEIRTTTNLSLGESYRIYKLLKTLMEN